MTEYNTIIQDPNPEQTAAQGIELPRFGDPQDTSMKIEVRPRKQRNINNIVADLAAEPVDPSPHSDTVNEALSAGYSRQEVTNFIAQSSGLTPEDADFHVIDSVSAKIKEAQKAGYNQGEVKDFLIQKRYDPSVIDQAMKASNGKDAWKNYEYKPTKASERAQDITELYTNVHSKYSTLGNEVLGIFDNREAANQANQDIADLNDGILNILAKNNIKASINPGTGEIDMQEEDGSTHPIDSSFLNSMFNSKSEMVGAMAGGALGARFGVGGAIAGSMAGSAIGRGVDIAINAMKLKETIDDKLYVSQMVQAGIFDGVVGTVGGALVAGTSKAVMKAYKYYVAGNAKGAVKALLENLNITKEQAADITAQWERNLTKAPEVKTGIFNTKDAAGNSVPKMRPMNADEKTIAAVTLTQQKVEDTVARAAAQNTRLANVVKTDISTRAKAINKVVNELADDNTGAAVRTDLDVYQKDVKDFYAQVKQIGAEAVDGTDYRFKLADLAIEPILANLQKVLANPAGQEQLLKYAVRIDNASRIRTFSGLIDLRQAVNDFKYSKNLDFTTTEAVNKVLNKIDSQIVKAAREYIPHGEQWLKDFASAKSEYSKMKVLEENMLYKAVNRKGITEEGIQKFLSKYANSKDVDAETFNAVVQRLSPSTRAKVEGAAIKNLTAKWTFGEATDLQAVHFPMLEYSLKALNIVTPEAKQFIKIVEEMNKVFKNDAKLSGINTGTSIDGIQSAMSKDLLLKMEYSIATQAFNTLKRLLPTRSSNNLALIAHVSRLLENPMHAKTAEDLIRQIPKGPQQDAMKSLVKELQIQTAKRGPVVPKDFHNMYKQSKSGKLVTTDGAFGKGIYLVDKILNPTPEMNIIKHEVNLSRMATFDDIASLRGKPTTEADFTKLTKQEKNLVIQQLQEKKFVGIRGEGKGMLFPETTVTPVKKGK